MIRRSPNFIMSSTNEHPMALACQIARLLESDPISARQVREYISPERLAQLLEIELFRTETLEEAFDNCDVDRTDIDDWALEHVVKTFSKADVLEAFIE